MRTLILIIAFAGVLLAGDVVMKFVDSFIARHVVKCNGNDAEEQEHEEPETAAEE